MSATKNFFRAAAEDFKKIPGSPVAYWVSDAMGYVFSRNPTLASMGQTSKGVITGDNARFMRTWWEIALVKMGFNIRSINECIQSRKMWFPCNKGGGYRKWYGNNDFVINWENDGYAVMHPQKGETRHCQDYYEWCKFQPCVSWTSISSSRPSFRYKSNDLVDHAGMAYFMRKQDCIKGILGLVNSKVAERILNILSPTLNYNAGEIGKIPVSSTAIQDSTVATLLVSLSKADWDAYETSWDFANNPLVDLARGVNNSVPSGLLADLYSNLREKWAKDCEEMRRLEMENNRIFIEAYGLKDELTPEVPWEEITLTCNPFYRYGVKEVENAGGDGAVGVCALPRMAELEERLKADTIKELISYAVGCMMGRYSLSKPGLILADQGSTITDYWAKVGEGAFSPDDDGIIPVLDDDCFADDIVTQFEKFLVAAFGAAQLGANRAFIEQALGKDLRSYFVKDFYADHLQRYQKRPIYWLFSSPKGTFNALVYLQRYQSNTAGQVLGYLRSFITKLQAKIEAADKTAADPNASQSFRTRAIKERTKLARQLKELEDYEREVLHPLSLQHVALDLDDGVKVNYLKLGAALKKIPGLEAKE